MYQNREAILVEFRAQLQGCKNFGGRGYKYSYFKTHICAHNAILTQKAEERENVAHLLSELGTSVLCRGCCRVVAYTNAKLLCKSCDALSETGKIHKALSDKQREVITEKIRLANRTRLRIISEIPKALRKCWSDCVSSTLMKFSAAKTDEDSFLALESWVKLKSVLVLPVNTGKRRASSNRKFHQQQMHHWLAGNEDLCWQEANSVEQERQKYSRREGSGNPGGRTPRSLTLQIVNLLRRRLAL